MIKEPCVNNLLGRTVVCRMGLVLRVNEIDTDMFSDVGPLNCEHVKIDLRPDTKPVELSHSV